MPISLAEKSRRLRAAHPENPEKVRSYELRHRYGITADQYDKMLSGGCAICRRPCLSGQRLSVDHATGRVRELLCRECNLGLGQFEDSIERLVATQYLESATIDPESEEKE